MPIKTLRIIVADDHPFILAGVRDVIARDPSMILIGEAPDGLEAFRLAQDLKPDIMVLDLSMPGMSGVTVARRLREAGSPCKIIALTVHDEPKYLRQLLEVGMSGYVLKIAASRDLVSAIRVVAQGGVYLDPSIASQIVETTMKRGTNGNGHAELSQREEHVLRLAARGNSNKAIAVELTLGHKTVATYKARAMEKLGFQSRVDIIRYASERGWLTNSS